MAKKSKMEVMEMIGACPLIRLDIAGRLYVALDLRSLGGLALDRLPIVHEHLSNTLRNLTRIAGILKP